MSGNIFYGKHSQYDIVVCALDIVRGRKKEVRVMKIWISTNWHYTPISHSFFINTWATSDSFVFVSLSQIFLFAFETCKLIQFREHCLHWLMLGWCSASRWMSISWHTYQFSFSCTYRWQAMRQSITKSFALAMVLGFGFGRTLQRVTFIQMWIEFILYFFLLNFILL